MMEIGPLEAASSVYPSAGLGAAMRVPSEPPAPGRLSMTNGWPSDSCSFCASMRAAMSVAWPGGQGTITFTAWLGYDCAYAMAHAKASARKVANLVIVNPPEEDSR